MDSKILSQIIKQVYQKYPDMQGIIPKIQEVPVNPGQEKRFTLTFHTNALSANQKRIPKYVRATVNEKGKILKLSASR